MKLAHPGRTAADDCHYCRTNCDYWGEAWDERHCHGYEYTAPIPAVVSPKLLKPTVLPARTVSVTSTPIPAPISVVETGSQGGGWLFPGFLVAVLLAVWGYSKFKK